jgi:hypothetical protein
MDIRYSTLLHLPPLRFHCVRGCWDRTQDCCDSGIDSQTNSSARSHPHIFHNELMFLYLIKIRMFMIFSYRRTATEKTTRQYTPQTNPITLEHQDEAANLTEDTIAADIYHIFI